MNNPIRRFLFDNYWWIVGLILLIVIPIAIMTSRQEVVTANVATICGAALGVVFFVQKQKLEELKMFEQLFMRFNERYAKLNDRMQAIVLSDDRGGEIIHNARNTLDDYFNLCAEEYLFYEQGHIIPLVWRSWCRGMLFYLKCARVRSYWESEVSQDSHYGLSEDIIRSGSV